MDRSPERRFHPLRKCCDDPQSNLAPFERLHSESVHDRSWFGPSPGLVHRRKLLHAQSANERPGPPVCGEPSRSAYSGSVHECVSPATQLDNRRRKFRPLPQGLPIWRCGSPLWRMGATVPAIQRALFRLGLWFSIWALGVPATYEPNVAVAHLCSGLFSNTLSGPNDSVVRSLGDWTFRRLIRRRCFARLRQSNAQHRVGVGVCPSPSRRANTGKRHRTFSKCPDEGSSWLARFHLLR